MQALPFRPVGTGLLAELREWEREFWKSAGFFEEGANWVSSRNSCEMIVRGMLRELLIFAWFYYLFCLWWLIEHFCFFFLGKLFIYKAKQFYYRFSNKVLHWNLNINKNQINFHNSIVSLAQNGCNKNRFYRLNPLNDSNSQWFSLAFKALSLPLLNMRTVCKLLSVRME